MTVSTLDLYKEIIPAFGLKVTDEGFFLTQNPSGTDTPSTIDGKRLVLPTKEMLRKGFGDDFIPFHPLSESLSRSGTSDVQRRLQKSAKAIIGHHLVTLASALLEASSDKKLHETIRVSDAQFLRKLTSADKSTVVALNKVLANATKRNRLVTVYLKASGMHGGKKMNRVTTIRFPFLNDIHEDKPVGVKLNKTQKETLIALFEIIIPNALDHEEYSAGTNSRVAPFFTSFLTAYHKTISGFNGLIKMYNKALSLKLKQIPLYDVNIVDSFAKAYSEIPPLKGNLGATEGEEEAETSVETKPRGATASVAQVDELPWVETKPKTQPWREGEVAAAKPATSGSVSVSDFLSAMNPQTQMGFTQQMQQPMQQQMQQPNFNYQNNQQAWGQTQGFQQQPQMNNNPYMQTIQAYGVPQQQQQMQPQAWGQPQMQQQPMQQQWGQQPMQQQWGGNTGLGLV